MSKKLPKGTLDRLWRDPGNWRGLGIYSCEDDPRVIVPKRMKGLGWTMNFANPWAWPAIFTVVASVSLPVIYLQVHHALAGAVVFTSFCVVALVAVCVAMSSPDRYEEQE